MRDIDTGKDQEVGKEEKEARGEGKRAHTLIEESHLETGRKQIGTVMILMILLIKLKRRRKRLRGTRNWLTGPRKWLESKRKA